MGRTPVRETALAEQIADLQKQLEALGVESAEVGFDPGGVVGLGSPTPVVRSIKLASKAIESVAAADPSNIQQVAASQLELSNSYYQSVLNQAGQSFLWAIVACGIGLVFFLAAVAFVLVESQPDAAIISAISGGIVQAIAGLNFWLYGKTAQQLDAFHLRIDQTQRFLLANSVCESLSDTQRDAARSNLISVMIASPNANGTRPAG